MNQKSVDELMAATPEEWDLWNKCVEGLATLSGFSGTGHDKYGVRIPYGSGPHIFKHFQKAIDVVRPRRILEVGFNLGFSSAMILNLCDAEIVSLDVSDKEETIHSADVLTIKYPERFQFFFRNDFDSIVPPEHKKFDLIFIDGDHKEQSIVEDTQMAIDLGIPYILYDDVYPIFGETLAALEKFPQLELIEDMDNLRLYKNNSNG